jgi:hypothetical protein
MHCYGRFIIFSKIHGILNGFSRYGGDPTQIYLMGFHSGAHLCTLTVLVNTLNYLKTANLVKLPRKTDILIERFPKINATLPQIRGLIL